MHYWFRPKRFWKYWAFYVPTNTRGWLVTIVFFLVAVTLFRLIDEKSHSVADTLLAFAPWAIALMALYDLLCLRMGEYPAWWKKSQS